jgi:hypothetical protein
MGMCTFNGQLALWRLERSLTQSLCEVEETFIFSAFLWVWELKKRARTHPGLRVSRPTTFCIGISDEKGVSSVLLPYTVETRADP